MEVLNIGHLQGAVKAGGPSTLSSVTPLSPAAGPHASVAPARYLKGSNPTYIYEDRYVDGQPVTTVLIDSKSSVANRMEDAILAAIIEGHELLSRLPRIEVRYEEPDGVARTFSCLELPHRAYDGHIRAGSIGGKPTTQVDEYIAARNSDPSNALVMANTSFATVAFGGWDSSRRARQGRFPSLMVGEILGVLANQESAEPRPAQHSGARVDPVAMGFEFKPAQIASLADAQSAELSPKLLRKKSTMKASQLGLGAIPPQADGLAGIATRQIIRTHVLSFALLRRMRFGSDDREANEAIRVLIAATLLNAMARSDAELYLRANCHLVEAGSPTVTMDGRLGESAQLAPLTVPVADALLEEAHETASRYGIDWQGVTLHVDGNPLVIGAIDDSDDGS